MEHYATLLSFGPDGWGMSIAWGLLVTISLAIATLPVGLALGFLVALGKQSQEPSIRLASNIYTTIFRGLPELLTLFLVYFGASLGLQRLLSLFGVDANVEINAFAAGMVALGFVFSSYSSEVFLSAFRAIPRGQYEGGYAVGLSHWQTMRKVVLPQLIRIALPGLANLWLVLLKDTSLVSVITLSDILRQTSIAARVTKEPFLFFGVACLLYLGLAIISSYFINRIARWADAGNNAVAGCMIMSEITSRGAAEVLAPPPVVKSWTGIRIAGHLIVAFWALLFAGLAIYLYNTWRIDLFETYAPRYWSGLLTTLQLVAVSIVIGALLSLPITAARMSNNRWLRGIAFGYVYFFRGTPLLAQTFLIYYGFGTFRPFLESIGLWVFFRDAWNCAILAFSLNTAAYQAEILRGAIQSVALGQWEGAAALGISKRVTFWKVILPQALIVALRPYGNEIILMIKGSAIVSIITILDLMGETRRAYSRTFDFQTYLWAAVIYLLIVECLRHIWDFIERRLTRHLVR